MRRFPRCAGPSRNTQASRCSLPEVTGESVASAAHLERLLLSVVVPSYRRPGHLARCLDGLARQDVRPDEVLVVHRQDDRPTRELVAAFDFVQPVPVAAPGQVAALVAGARVARGDIVGFTDDDAVPGGDWCGRLLRSFEAGDVGAVGGRDVVHHGDVREEGAETRVGVVNWLGRVVGHHHVGVGAARDVDHLKGVNMAFRRSCLRFPAGLRGSGAQVGNDLAMSLAVRGAGRRVVYDPSIVVHHFPGERFDADGRDGRAMAARADAAFNQSYVLFALRPDLRWRRMLYVVAWGDRDNGGMVRSAVAWIRREQELKGMLVPLLRAQLDAWRLAGSAPLRLIEVS